MGRKSLSNHKPNALIPWCAAIVRDWGQGKAVQKAVEPWPGIHTLCKAVGRFGEEVGGGPFSKRGFKNSNNMGVEKIWVGECIRSFKT